ncbi:MAG: hypothetical protein H7Y15_07080, partial [Pseudonocardia sp.]|nr:hypothetical protein [Pseudonocardia sp.]
MADETTSPSTTTTEPAAKRPPRKPTTPAPASESGNTAVDPAGDHDRVQMLSLRADGTPDQYRPELIGDPAATLAATEVQFKQQAVSGADQAARGVTSTAGTVVEDAPQDPTIADLQDK